MDDARRVGRLGWLAAGLLVLLVAGYLGLAWHVTNRVPEGTTLGGVAIGGKNAADAERAVREKYTPITAAPLTVRVGDKTAETTAGDLGLRIDHRASLAPLVGFTLDPRLVWQRLQPGTGHDLVVTTDSAKLTEHLDALATATVTDPVDGSIAFADGTIVRTEPVLGVKLDIAAATRDLPDRWLPAALGSTEIDLATAAVQPAIDTTDLDSFTAQFAGPATSAPVTVVVAGVPVSLAPTAITPALRVEAKDGALFGSVDGPTVAAALVAPGTGVGAAAEDARFEIQNGAVVIVPQKNGANVDPAVAASALQQAIAAPDRQAAIDVVATEPKVTTAALEQAGVTEVVSEFSSKLTDNAGRTENIRIAANTVNGTYLAPGETFSLNDKLGRRTAEKGYNQAPVISGGRLTMGTGGGVSQVATTLFNGMFFAGLKDVEHKPHSFYISRYPEGREATVAYSSVDLKFTNDSPHGVFIEMWVADGHVHTRFWSTKVWEIEAVKGPRTNVKPPRTIRDSSPGCVSQSPADGFKVTVTRIFRQGGVEQKREEFNTTYIPEDRVICS